MEWRGKDLSAQLVISPQTIRALVLMPPPTPHYRAVWDITGEAPELVQHVLAGESVPEATDEQAIEAFTSLVMMITTPPRIDILGTRVKG